MDFEMLENDVRSGSDIEGELPSSTALSSPKKKRGPSKGPNILPDGQMRTISTNEYGIPNNIDEDTKALQSDIGLQVRDLLPVAYKRFDKLPDDPIKTVTDVLKKRYTLRYVKSSWLEQKIKKAWRDRKFKLRKDFITNKNVAEVKAGKTPAFVTKEDWHKFIDMSTTPEFEAMSQRNTIIMSKSEMPYTAGRHSSAQICHKIAKERNLLSDCEVGRTETYIQTHLSKNEKKPCHEKLNKMRSIMRAEPETRLTSVNDALVKALEKKDTRGRTRAMAPGISPTFLKESTHMVNKIVDTQRDNAKKDLEVENVKARVDDLTNIVRKFIDSQGRNNKNFVSPHSASSSTPSSLPQHQDESDVGKKCEVYGWGDILVAYGEVVAVDPQVIVHNVKMGDGNYKLLIESAEVPSAMLFRPNSQVAVIDDVVNSYTVWPKAFLKFVN